MGLTIHITCNENIKLKDLSNLLDTINLSVNDYYRNNGIGNNKLSKYAAIVNKVGNGSILLEIAIDMFVPVTASMLAEYVLNRMRKQKNTHNGPNNGLDNIHIRAEDNCTINIHIDYNNKN